MYWGGGQIVGHCHCEGRRWETRVEATVLIQVINDGCLDQGGSRGGLRRGGILDVSWRRSQWALVKDVYGI